MRPMRQGGGASPALCLVGTIPEPVLAAARQDGVVDDG
jgi:hypothetical protein